MAPRVPAGLLTVAAAAGAAASQEPPDPDAVVAALVEHHHGALSGTFETALLALRDPDDGASRIVVALPDRMRVDRPDGRIELLRHDVGWSCRAGVEPERLQGEALSRLLALRDHVRAVLLAPLWEREDAERDGDGSLLLAQPDGTRWTLRAGGDPLHVRSLQGPRGTVTFEAFLDTGSANLPALVELPGLGRRGVEFEASDLWLDPALFEDPFASTPSAVQRGGARMRRPLPGTGADFPADPEVQHLGSRAYLVLGHPGTWRERVARLAAAGRQLARQGQMPDGSPTYVPGPDGIELRVPFRPDPGRGHPPFVRAEGQVVQREPPRDVVVVSPPAGTWQEVERRGREMLEAFAAAQGLRADGAMRMIPWLDPVSVPSDDALRQLKVRVELPVVKD